MGKSIHPKSKSRRNKSYSGIEQHKIQGKTLISPFMNYPNLAFSSWIDDRLPELLWACLLVSCTARESALVTFREVINYIYKKAPEATGKITHTGLSQLDEQKQQDILSIITGTNENKEVLYPLLLFENLPAKNQWAHFLPTHEDMDISPLTHSVAKSLNHQSQQSTDCRWLWVMTFLMTGKAKIHDKEMIKGLFYYPNYGDMRRIRPYIRAMEGALSQSEKSLGYWPTKFWEESLNNTPCYPLPSTQSQYQLNPGTSLTRVNEVYQALKHHMSETITTTAIDPKHDTTFGIALYSLSILNELLRIGNSTSILGRAGLRIILECFITLNYLVVKNNESLWQMYRVYGAGQAKLAFIKLDELNQDPSYVDRNTLQQLANEDMWQEYLNINLGHWNKMDLRKLSVDSNVKDIYDKFYPWTSCFSHGHWGSVRDTIFETCGNPLHRLHRIPRENPRMLPDIISDTCYLIDRILELVSKIYSTFDLRVTINP